MSDEFVKNICRTVGHEWKKNIENFSHDCQRCKESKPWNIDWQSKIASAMTAPLKTTLDYQGIARKIIKVEEIKSNDLPIYDNDLPNQDSQA